MRLAPQEPCVVIFSSISPPPPPVKVSAASGSAMVLVAGAAAAAMHSARTSADRQGQRTPRALQVVVAAAALAVYATFLAGRGRFPHRRRQARPPGREENVPKERPVDLPYPDPDPDRTLDYRAAPNSRPLDDSSAVHASTLPSGEISDAGRSLP